MDDVPNTDKMDVVNIKLDRLAAQMDLYMSSKMKKKLNKQIKPAEENEHDDFSTDFTKDENEDRGNWSGRLDFLLACLGYAVGLGNVWRFPYLCYKNGGAVFFIPYIIMLVFVGIPIFFFELSLGQFTSSGPLTCWEFAPFFKGIGVAMVIVSALVGIYYNMIIAWSLYYLFASFTTKLPWKECNRDWATDYDNWVPFGIYNNTLAEENNFKRVLPTEQYLNRHVLGKDLPGIGMDNMGKIKWELVLCFLLAWIIVALSLIKGVKSSGKVVYFTALFPYVVLVILLVRGLTLQGYYQGIEFYILKPDFSKLASSGVWKDAAVQIFFSLSDSWGGLIALASYNRFHNDALRDSLIVSIGNCLTSFFAGFVIFSFLGFLAYSMDTTVDKVAESGVGLAFIVYPAAVVRMPVSVLWAILFFVMLITLGLDSEGGAYMLQLMDHYSGGWNVLLIAFCECISIAYVYGFCRFKEDIRIMIGNNPCCCFPWNCCYYWWAACWYFFTPVGVVFILIYSWVDYSEVTYGDYVYPQWAAGLGWLMTLAVVCGIFVTGFGLIIRQCVRGEPILNLFKPTRYWGPYLKKHRRLMLRYLEPSQVDLDPWNEVNGNPVQMDDIKVIISQQQGWADYRTKEIDYDYLRMA
ncbi:hypothetical protein LSH36_377g03025 [Paralvinella palmiformis]|uniref:Transporter n=1 Tax=Paralvinella palmiformis TaxID=53620 RepID=A0AAD9JDU8_9ANNE|nr:hypothetical protein LSH36_377g03025 [Paralvinella palmiformis]